MNLPVTPSILRGYENVDLRLACCRRHRARQLVIFTPSDFHALSTSAWDYLNGRGWELCMANLGPKGNASYYHWNRAKALKAGPSRRLPAIIPSYQKQMF